MRTLVLFCLVAAATAATDQAHTNASVNWNEVWTLSFTGANLDPSKWGDTFKSRVYHLIGSAAFAFFLSVPLSAILGLCLFLYGVVRLTIPICFTSVVAVAGFKRSNTIWLLCGVVGTYFLLFGVSLLPQ